MWAASAGHAAAVKALLAAGADVNLRDQDGGTALAAALRSEAAKQHPEIADLLRRAGAKE